jgi:bifunctional UDP-N-acetylglucosamine pyrophosphorylase/glucosamine-1-phosphate N-acetyltransferase
MPFAGRPLGEHLRDIVKQAGLDEAFGPGPLVVIDGLYAGLQPDTLAALASTVRERGGVLKTADGRIVAVAHPDADPHDEPAELLKRPAGAAKQVVEGEQAQRVEDWWSLAMVEKTVVRGWLRAMAATGVRLVDPESIFVEWNVKVSPGAILWPNVVLRGETVIHKGAEVRANCWLQDTVVGERSLVKPGTVCERATIGADCAVGPMAHLRPAATLDDDVKVGNFVEVKKAHLATGVRASHLTYLGDAEVGERTNVGAGTITCNYDGFGKHLTTIGSDAFIGSNTALVAPVTVGDGAIVGAGSTVTRDVPDDSLYLGRAPDRIYEGKAPSIRSRARAKAERADG